MSRQSFAPSRALSLTEELEKLEQSITLTLQEIDHNFSRAHRIVTSSILPIVEQYAEHSKAVWDGSKFWKQFFEASANVSLSGYEELAGDEEEALEHDNSHVSQHTEDETYGSSPSRAENARSGEDGDERGYEEGPDDSLLASPSQEDSHSTPRMAEPQRLKGAQREIPNPPTFANFSSPYEALRRELQGASGEDGAGGFVTEMPTTPGRQRLPDLSMTPQASPYAETERRRLRDGGDLLLHRVLDKNYRLQATPHTQQKLRSSRKGTTPATTHRQPRYRESTSPLSSPPVAAPQLHAEIFSSPMRAARTPGVSVHTPVAANKAYSAMGKGVWDSDSDIEEDGMGELSPPKTVQFHVPTQRLLQTPAREASKRIVEDLLMTAGGDVTDDLDSPMVVKPNEGMDESF